MSLVVRDYSVEFMTEIIGDTMNLKLNNETMSSRRNMSLKTEDSLVKEERRRMGRYIAILVGIMLFLLALYHAWVRRIPVVASLVIPALIMFIYVAWVLYTASRDKHRLLDMEAALADQNEEETEPNSPDALNLEITVISSKDNANLSTPEDRRWTDLSSALFKGREYNGYILPIILINDEPPEDLDQKWLNIVEKVTNNDKLKGYHSRKKFKRKFCRKRRYAAFKRSYSIG